MFFLLLLAHTVEMVRHVHRADTFLCPVGLSELRSVWWGARALEVERILTVKLSDSPYSSLSSDINMGQKILVRLRPHFDPNAFFPEEDVLHTMLHEVSERSSLSIPIAHRALSHPS